MTKKSPEKKADEAKLVHLMDHYVKGVQQMDTRRTRKPGGWNDVINAYMGKLPANWPYISQFTDPVVRTTILEKTSRLLNAKLRGRLAPREGGDMVKAKINNAILDFQWDNATEGGAMIEKVAMNDQLTRLFGASFALVYWNNKKNTNEIKVIDPRDIFIDFAASHVRNAKWVQVREFTTPSALEARGYDVKALKEAVKKGVSDHRDTAYVSQVLANRGLQDFTGMDLDNPTIEVVTEWTPKTCTIFAPNYGTVVKESENPYDHGRIPVAQLRYYPLPDDVYGESEVEPVIPLQKVINAALCGFFDEMNLAMRPPLKIVSGQVRMETIEYGPGARWILNTPNAVSEAQLGANSIAAFTTTYPALKAAFNTAMGDQSLGLSNIRPFGKSDKTATEVNSLEKQQNNRDQYNQLYLGEFLKDIMMMWLSNNQQYLFDDPTKEYIVLKIVGKDNIRDFQMMKLDEKDIPSDALAEISQALTENPEISEEELIQMASDLAVPTNPVIKNPKEKNPANLEVAKKLDVGPNQDYADLYVTKEDMDGTYDYIPDVSSMAIGASVQQQAARQRAYDLILTNPNVLTALQTQGDLLDIKELITRILEDAGEKDPDGLFKNGQTTVGPSIPGGPSSVGPGQAPNGAGGIPNIPANPQTISSQPGAGGLPPAQGLPIQ